jgi:hypothetical protein
MKGCVDILKEFGIVNNHKYGELHRRVEKEDLSAYKEISALLEEVTTSVKELSVEGA